MKAPINKILQACHYCGLDILKANDTAFDLGYGRIAHLQCHQDNSILIGSAEARLCAALADGIAQKTGYNISVMEVSSWLLANGSQGRTVAALVEAYVDDKRRTQEIIDRMGAIMGERWNGPATAVDVVIADTMSKG